MYSDLKNGFLHNNRGCFCLLLPVSNLISLGKLGCNTKISFSKEISGGVETAHFYGLNNKKKRSPVDTWDIHRRVPFSFLPQSLYSGRGRRTQVTFNKGEKKKGRKRETVNYPGSLQKKKKKEKE